MAKALPYFKFYCSEWNDGDITLEDMKTQGVFINICSYYWSQECEISFEKLLKRFKNYKKQIENLKKAKIIFSENENLVIKFLDKQWSEREAVKLRNQQNGKAGGRPKKTQSVKSGKPKTNPSETNIEEEENREEKNIKTKAKNNDIEIVMSYFREVTGLGHREPGDLNARLKDGYTVKNAKDVIDIKSAEWKGTENAKWLRPNTLFCKKNFDGYLNQAPEVDVIDIMGLHLDPKELSDCMKETGEWDLFAVKNKLKAKGVKV